MKSTFLKVMAILCLIFGIIGALVSIAGIAVTGMLSSGISQAMNEAGLEVSQEAAAIGAGVTGMIMAATVFLVIESIIMILGGVFGMKASSNVAKVGPAIVMGIIMIIFAVISLIISGATGTITWTNFTSLIIPVLYCLAAFLFKKKAA